MDSNINKVYEITIRRLKKDNQILREENDRMAKILHSIKKHFIFTDL
tara:strand:+ start:428 stop:568 length:141 start_codon:yes stop_codon:yes gene_type:complete